MPYLGILKWNLAILPVFFKKEDKMKKLSVLLPIIIFSFFSSLSGQWLEQMMYLPDSFGGLYLTTSIYFYEVNDQLFVWGGCGSSVLKIDCATDEKIQPIRIDNTLIPEPWSFTYNSYNNCLYGLTEYNNESCSLYAINCQTGQVVATIPIHYPIVSLCANNISNKVYLVCYDSLFIIDAGVHGIRKTIRLDMLTNSPPPIYNPKHDVAYIYSEGKLFVLDGATDSIIDTIFAPNFIPSFGNELLDTINDRFYVWGADTSQPATAKILVIDCLTNQVVADIGIDPTVTQYGVDIDIDPVSQKLFVSPVRGSGQTIWVFNPVNGVIEDSIRTQFNLYGVRYCTTNNRLYTSTDNSIMAINPINHQIDIIDLNGFYPTSGYGFHNVWFLHPLRNKLYITVAFSYLFVIDCVTNQITKKLGLGVFQPKGFLWNPITDRFYCPDIVGPIVHCIDAATNQALYSIILPIPGYGLYKLALSTQQNKIYIGFLDGIVVLDGAVDTVIKVIWFEPGVRNLCYNPTSDKIYGSSNPYTCIINCANDEIISVINTEWASLSFCNPRTNKVYVTGTKTYIIDGAGDTLLATLDSIGGSIAFREIGELVYISYAWFLNSLVILDGRTNQILEYLPNFNSKVIYNPINDRLYCGNLVLDCATNLVVDTLPVVLNEAIHNPINNKLYSYDSSSVVVIDCVTNEIIARFTGLRNHFRTPTWNSIQNRTYVYLDQESRLAVIRDEIQGIEDSKRINSARYTPEIYPNPAKSFLTIRLPLSMERKELKIFDVSGKLVKVEKVRSAQSHQQEVRISLKGINPGIYFLKAGKETKKFLVLK